MVTQKRVARLLLHGVSSTDALQIGAVIANTRYKCFVDWQVCTEGEADVLILGSDDPSTVRGLLNEPFRTLKLSPQLDEGDPTGSSLVSPLPYVAFAKLLERIDRDIALRDSHARAAALQALPRPDFKATVPDEELIRSIFSGEALVRLRLTVKPKSLRGCEMESSMIHALQSRFMHIEELLDLSGAPRERCEALLSVLSITDLIEVIPRRRRASPMAPLNWGRALSPQSTSINSPLASTVGA